MTHRAVLAADASHGVGHAAVRRCAERGDTVYSVSRRPSSVGTWIEADLAADEGIEAAMQSLGARRLDALLFMGGVWEEGASTDRYEFLTSPRVETRQVIAVNLIAPILLTQALVGNLAQSEDPRIVLTGPCRVWIASLASRWPIPLRN